jgi:hypothetical protein
VYPSLLKPIGWLAGLPAIALLLAGCATTKPLDAYSPRPQEPATALLALSPGAGAILGVVETGYVNAVEQTISLDSTAKVAGQNYIKIQMFETNAHSSTPGGLQDVPLANLDLAGEARGTVNYADMKLSPYFVQNLYGPFGYSMGRTEFGDLCMYAWQRISPDMMPGGGVARGAINLRALICDGRKTERELLDVMFQMRIKGVAGQATRAPAAIGAYGIEIVPVGVEGFGDVLPSTTPAPVVSQPAPLREVESEPEDVPGPVTAPSSPNGSSGVPSPEAPPPNAPIVPLPTASLLEALGPPITFT